MPDLAAGSAPLTPVAGPRRAPAPPLAQAPPRDSVGFALFLVLNATLFVRPAEVVPALLGWEIYQALILLCLLASFPAILAQLQARALESRPITVFVLGLLPAVVLSQLSNGRPADAAVS